MENFEYKDDKIERISHTEGYITPRTKRADEGSEFVGLGGLVWQYTYVLKDHLGNTRVTFADANNNNTIDPNTEINQINHYYPFGLNMEGNWNGASPDAKNKFQYNGKELQTDFGLDWNDYGARSYDAAIGRFTAIDPMAEVYLDFSGYHYVQNSPINLIDPTGMMSEAYSFGMQNHEKNSDDIMEEQRSKMHENDDKNKIHAYISNNSKDVKSLVDVISMIDDIFSRNGITGISFHPISPEAARKKNFDDETELFVEIVKRDPDKDNQASPGNTYPKSGSPGLINFLDIIEPNNSTTKQKVVTYANTYFAKNDYQIAYIVAHEFLHQLYAKSIYNRSKGGSAYYNHTNATQNLNTDGYYTKIPMKAGTKKHMHPEEQIPVEMKAAIKKYIKNYVPKA